MGPPVRCISASVLSKPPQGGRRFIILWHGNNEVALLEEFIPRDVFGQITAVKHASDPIQFCQSPFGVYFIKSQSLGQKSKDFVIRFRLSQGLDAFLLQADDSVVGLAGGIRDIAETAGEFADVPPFKIGAGRQ